MGDQGMDEFEYGGVANGTAPCFGCEQPTDKALVTDGPAGPEALMFICGACIADEAIQAAMSAAIQAAARDGDALAARYVAASVECALEELQREWKAATGVPACTHEQLYALAKAKYTPVADR